MPIQDITLEQFTVALPVHKVTREPLFGEPLYRSGQWVFTAKVSEHVIIKVFSGIARTKRGRPCGEDSIKVVALWSSDQYPCASKIQSHFMRGIGWEERLQVGIRRTWKIGLMCKPCEKTGCGGRVGVFRMKKGGPDVGRWFALCNKCKYMSWLGVKV